MSRVAMSMSNSMRHPQQDQHLLKLTRAVARAQLDAHTFELDGDTRSRDHRLPFLTIDPDERLGRLGRPAGIL